MSAFQAEDEGLIPSTRSSFCVMKAEPNQATRLFGEAKGETAAKAGVNLYKVYVS